MPGVIRVGTPFTWGVIDVDPDDNKFVNRPVLWQMISVTYDRHFDVVSEWPFPHVDMISTRTIF